MAIRRPVRRIALIGRLPLAGGELDGGPCRDVDVIDMRVVTGNSRPDTELTLST